MGKMKNYSTAQIFLKIINKIEHIDPQAKILDLGCGEGAMLHEFFRDGYDVYGCDFINNNDLSDFTTEIKEQFEKGRVLPIEDPYRLPFRDNTFDYIFSSQVFEHVMDYDITLKEINRILKPKGININIFPGRYRPIENHVGVPLATVVRNKAWLYIWALLGVRNQFQKGKTVAEVTQLNYDYLNSHTNYPTRRKLLSYCDDFDEARFREDILLQVHNSIRVKALKFTWKIFPFITTLISDCYSRVMVLRK